MSHIPVLMTEVLSVLSPAPGEVYLDCTAGLGGHASEIARRIAPGGTVVLNDVDPANLRRATEAVRKAADGIEVLAFTGNFADAPRKLSEQGVRVDMVLADLGFASNQMSDPARGLSFSRDGPLDMRLDPSLPITAADLVAGLSEEELTELIRMNGEERDAARIARKLVRARQDSPITTTGRFAEVVRSALPRKFGPSAIDPATRTFQAVRIAVNDEIGSLEGLLAAVHRSAKASVTGGGRDRVWLKTGARVAVIGFHSLEDRPVKRSMAELASAGLGELLTDGPVGPGEREASENPRSRSARLRAIRLLGG